MLDVGLVLQLRGPAVIRFASNTDLARRVRTLPPGYLDELQEIIVRRDDRGIWYDASHPAYARMRAKYRRNTRKLPPVIDRIVAVCQVCPRRETCRWTNSPQCQRERILRERKREVLAACCPVGTWGGQVDFVWGYYARPARGDELLYSVRSVMTNFIGTPRIWVVCDPADRPAWASEQIRFIDYRWAQGRRRTRVPFDYTDKLIAACRHGQIADSFCAMYDDTYFVNPVILPDITVPRAAKCWTKKALARWHPRRKHDCRRKRSMQLFADHLGHAWDFSTHMPYWYNKKQFIDITRRYRLQHKDFLRETAYFNAVLPKGEKPALIQPKHGPRVQYRTCKQPPHDMLARETGDILFLNHCNKSYTPDMQQLLGEHFPVLCAGEWLRGPSPPRSGRFQHAP